MAWPMTPHERLHIPPRLPTRLQGFGDLFVVRVAGNIVSERVLGRQGGPGWAGIEGWGGEGGVGMPLRVLLRA